MAAVYRFPLRPTFTVGSRPRRTRRDPGQGGFALVSVLMLTLLVFLTAAFALPGSLRARTFSIRSGTSQQALNVAEGGIDFALATLNATIAEPAYVPRRPLPGHFVSSGVNTWSYADGANGYFFRGNFEGMVPTLTIAIPSTPPIPNPPANDYGIYYRIISSRVRHRGTHQWVQAVVRLRTSKSPVDNAISGRAITARQDISPNGSSGVTVTDSYDSSVGPYDPANPGSNGAIYAGGSIVSGAVCNGSASAVGSIDPRLSVVGTGNTAASGVSTLPIADAPPAPDATPVVWSSGQTLDAPDGTAYDLGAVSLSGHATLTLEPGRYVMSSLSTTGNTAGLMINGDAGLVEIYVTGDIRVAGNGIVNTSAKPTSLLLVATNPTAVVNIAGNGNFYGVVFAPANAVTIGGNGQFFGAVTGNAVALNGNNATVHYDEAIGRTMVLPSTIALPVDFQILAINYRNRE